jgi:hypothetical protein
MRANKTLRSIGVAFSIALIAFTAHTQSSNNTLFSPYVNESGIISFPLNFRVSMAHMGSWFVPEGDASGFHDVYTEPTTIASYLANGEFPDGATIVKELRAHDSGSYTTGNNVSYASGELKQWFVMIKDTEGRFPNSDIWGEGWGWALFMPNDLTTNVATNYSRDCLDCHRPAEQNDWVYVEAYPSLSRLND